MLTDFPLIRRFIIIFVYWMKPDVRPHQDT